MKKYFYLQIKRILRFFPFAAVIALLLFSGLVGAFIGLTQLQNESEDVKKFKVGIVGDDDNQYLEFGLSALKTLDDTRFILELDMYEEADARQALERYEISAYFVFPEDFVEAALRGEVKTIRLITRTGDNGLILIFKEEIAQAVTKLLVESQKGVYGVQTALDANGYHSLAHKYLNKMNVEYIDFVADRASVYEVTTLGVSGGLSLPAYYFCSFAVLLLLLIGLPCAAIFVKKDWALSRILAAGNCRAGKQVICEYTAYTGFLLLPVSLLIAALMLLAGKLPQLALPALDEITVSFVFYMIPAALMLGAFHMMLFELSGNIVNGILLQFFCSVFLCYISGCFYPIYAFPEAVQTISAFLPTGLVRSYLAAGITGEGSMPAFLGICAFAAVFLGVTVTMRRYKITTKAG